MVKTRLPSFFEHTLTEFDKCHRIEVMNEVKAASMSGGKQCHRECHTRLQIDKNRLSHHHHHQLGTAPRDEKSGDGAHRMSNPPPSSRRLHEQRLAKKHNQTAEAKKNGKDEDNRSASSVA